MFEYFGEHDDDKALLCVAFLMEWASEAGNESVEGMTSRGLAKVIRLATRRIQLREEHRLREEERRAEASPLRVAAG